MPDERCAACGRVFNRASKPMHAFSTEGRPAGRVHTSCRDGWLTFYGGAGADAEPQFWIWLLHFCQQPDRDTPAFSAYLLLDGPQETLTNHQNEILTDYVRGKKQLTVAQVLEIVEAIRTLVGEYRAWQAALAPGV